VELLKIWVKVLRRFLKRGSGEEKGPFILKMLKGKELQ
jgi:hypothetical protein